MVATPALNVNQFSMVPVLGQLDMENIQNSVISGAVATGVSPALLAGQPVKVQDGTAVLPKVLALTSNTDTANAFVVRNLKDQSFPAEARLELAISGAIMWMNANAAIAKWGAVEVDTSVVGQVGPAAGINPVIGWAYDKATSANQLIRVFVDLPRPSVGAGSAALRTLTVTATLAQINAGLNLIPGVTGKKIRVTNYVARVLGAFTTGTAVLLQSNNVSPVLVTTLAEAGLTNGAVLIPASANTTLGAGFGAQLGSGDGLNVANSGSAQAGGTSITFTIDYSQN